MLPLNLNGADGTKELISTCESVGLEALVRVTSEAELSSALEMGAKMVVYARAVDIPQGGRRAVRTACEACDVT